MSIFDKLSGRFGDILDEVRIPEDLHRAHESAAASIAQGDFPAAISTLNGTIGRYPNVQRTFVLLAKAYKHSNQPRGALDCLDKALAIRPSAGLHLQAGEFLERLAQWRDAEHHLAEAAHLPDASEHEFAIAFALGRVLEAQGRRDRAEREYTRALEIEPNHMDVGHRLVRLLLARDVASARKMLQQLDRDRLDPRTNLLWALIAEKEGDLDEAQGFVQRSLEHVEDPETLVVVARLKNLTHQPNDALALLARIPETIPDDIINEMLRQRGHAQMSVSDFDAARATFAKLLSRRPEDPHALLGVGNAELELGKFDIANGFLLQAMSHSETRGGAVLGIGRSHALRGDDSSAKHYLEEALRCSIGPEDVARAHLELGLIAQRRGDHSDALRHLSAAVSNTQLAADAQTAMQTSLGLLGPRFEFPEDAGNPMAVEGLVRQCVEWLARETQLSAFMVRAQGLVQKLESPLSIAIVGEFNAGKSTLLNALLEEDLLPVGVLPTTAHTGIVRFGPRRAARLHLLDAPSREVNFEEAARVMKDNSADVARVDFMFPHPVLRSLEFWDTPGFNALEERHETVAANALETAEAILWVMDANQVLSATEFDRIDGLRHGVERLVVVVNKVDRLGRDREGKTQELLDYIDDNIGDQIAGAFAVSAKEAIDARPGKDGAFEDFRAYVNEHIVERAGRIKVIEVFFSLTGLFHDVRRFSADRQTSLTEAKRQLGEVGDWLTTDVQSTLERFVEDTRRHLEDRTTFMLDSIEREIADAMRPSGQLVTRHALSKTDAIFVGRLFVDRYHDILKVAFQETARVVDELEATMARRVENVVRLMSAEEARGQNRSLESLFDELRMHRAILEERLVGRLSARFTATVELVGPEVLMSIDGDKAMWRPKLRRLLPDSSQLGSTELTDWLRDWTSRMTVFILRLDAELAWISMDLEQRLNVDSMISWLESDAMSTTLHD